MTKRPDFFELLPKPHHGSPYGVVFVCTGNICRSPMAEIVTRALAEKTTLADESTLADRLIITSAGTGPWHTGEPMDPRARAALVRAGFPDRPHVARQISTAHLNATDLVIALDRRHQQTLRNLGTDPTHLALLRSFDPSSGAPSDVPDPFYGDDAAFDSALAMITDGCRGIVSVLASFWNASPAL